MAEISCAEKVMKALCDCSDRLLFGNPNERLILSQAIETLSRSLEILKRTAEGGAE